MDKNRRINSCLRCGKWHDERETCDDTQSKLDILQIWELVKERQGRSSRVIAEDIMHLIQSHPQQDTQRAVLEARIDDFTRMRDYYDRGNIKLWDEPDNNLNPVYLDDHLDELKQSLKQQGDKDE